MVPLKNRVVINIKTFFTKYLIGFCFSTLDFCALIQILLAEFDI